MESQEAISQVPKSANLTNTVYFVFYHYFDVFFNMLVVILRKITSMQGRSERSTWALHTAMWSTCWPSGWAWHRQRWNNSFWTFRWGYATHWKELSMHNRRRIVALAHFWHFLLVCLIFFQAVKHPTTGNLTQLKTTWHHSPFLLVSRWGKRKFYIMCGKIVLCSPLSKGHRQLSTLELFRDNHNVFCHNGNLQYFRMYSSEWAHK